MKYPNGINKKEVVQRNHGYSNRGMSLETDINATNEHYLVTNKANVHKKPTPIQVVKVNYPKRSAAVITEGYFKQASTTDYNGLYRNRYIDFEAKETKNKTSFPLSNIHEHQVQHMKSVIEHGGICFLIIRFTVYNETYYVLAEHFIPYWDAQLNGGRKSIPLKEIKENSYLIPFNYQARVDYLKVIDRLMEESVYVE